MATGPPGSGGLFDLFQMSLIEEDVLSLEDSDSEYFDTAEVGSSADEMDDCLSAVSEGLAVAEVMGPKSSEMPAERRKRQALIRQESQGGLCRWRPESSGSSSDVGCPMEGCGEWVTDLRGHCVQAHIPEVFRDLARTGEDIGRVRASALQTILRVLGGSGDLFGYVTGFLSAIGCLKGHSVKRVAMRCVG